MKRSISALVAATAGAALLPTALASAQTGTGTIAGTITAAEGGAALGDVCVDALPFDGSGPIGTRTAADGSFELEVPEDIYFLVVNACAAPRNGYVPTLRGSEGEADPFVEVRAGTTSSGVDAALATAGTIAGRVTEDGSGAALEDVCVQAQGVEALLPATAATAADGTYGITTAAPGDNEIVFIDCAAPRLHTPEVHPDVALWPLTDGEPLGEPVPVTAGATTTGIDAALALGGTVEGRVTLAHTGEAPPFAIVGAWERDDVDDLPTAIAFAGIQGIGIGTGFETAAPLPGGFDLAGLPPGGYAFELAPEAVGFGDTAGWRQRWYDGAEERAGARVVDVAAGERITDLQLELVPSSSIAPFCADSEAGYPDVPSSNVHATAIGCMRDADVVRGGEDGRYRPTEAVRRDQMASFIARVLRNRDASLLPSDPPDAFPDDDGNVHEASIDMLAAVGIVEGDGSGRYRPADAVGRGQMATFLARAYEAATGATLRTPPSSFGDTEGTAHAGSIRKVAVAAIATGTSASTYEPNAVVRRDQMATFLARLYTRTLLDAGMSFSSGTTTTMSARGMAWNGR